MMSDSDFQRDNQQNQLDIPLSNFFDLGTSPVNQNPSMLNVKSLDDTNVEADLLFLEAMKNIDYSPDIAYQNLHQVIQIDPTHAKAYLYLGWINFRFLKDKNKAEELYKKSLEIDPTFGITYIYLAQLLITLNRHEEALELLNNSNKAQDVSLHALNDLKGEIYEFLGKYDESLKYYREAIKYAFDSKSLNDSKLSLKRVIQKTSGHILHLQNY
jgi:tetratricopeptide (TPR) repeat protein